MFTFRGLTPPQIVQLLWSRRPATPPRHVFICIADHFEPMWKHDGKTPPPDSVERERVADWVNGYPRMAEGIVDSVGNPPQHTFFYPAEHCESEHLKQEHLEQVQSLCRAGFGEIEIHLHHYHDTAENTAATLDKFNRQLGELVESKVPSKPRSYAFVHGNWALCNSGPDSSVCGVDNEIPILLRTGCYADLTMPSAPANCQTATINSIYYAKDIPNRRRSHDYGTPARVGQLPPDNSLLMIQGPLALDWGKRKFGFVPGVENGDLTGNRPPTLARLKLWLRTCVHVAGRPDWVFIKLHTHGAQERNSKMLLGEPMRAFHQSLRRYSEERGFKYYYVTARQLASVVHQAEDGLIEPMIETRWGERRSRLLTN